MNADADDRHLVTLGRQHRREFHALADDDVGSPLGDRVDHPRERGAGVEADEDVADHLFGRGRARPQDVFDDLGRRLAHHVVR
jgi:hypothetical protein